MKYLLLLLMLPTLSWAAPVICLTQKTTASWEQDSDQDEYAQVQLAAYGPSSGYPSCEDTKKWERRLNWVTLGLGSGGLLAVCSGFGAGLAIPLEGGAILTGGLALYVGGLPCNDRMKEAELEAMTERIACEHLARSGIQCQFKYQNPLR